MVRLEGRPAVTGGERHRGELRYFERATQIAPLIGATIPFVTAAGADSTRRSTFDTAAELYDAARPRYADHLTDLPRSAAAARAPAIACSTLAPGPASLPLRCSSEAWS